MTVQTNKFVVLGCGRIAKTYQTNNNKNYTRRTNKINQDAERWEPKTFISSTHNKIVGLDWDSFV